MISLKHLFAILTLAISGPALAQYTARLPSTCSPDGARCTQAQPVVNPDGSMMSGVPNDTYLAPTTIPATLGSAYTVQLGKGQGTVAFPIIGLTASGATLSATYSDDNGANYYPVRNIGTATVPGSTTFTADGPISFTAGGHTQLRLTVTTAGTGSITIGSNASVPVRAVNLEGAGTANTNPFFVNSRGDLDQLSTRLGVSYSVGTGIISIPANNYLNVVFTCAAPAGSVCIVYLRGYGNGSTTTLQYQNFRGPAAITGGTTKAVGNKSLAANALTSTSGITYATSTATISTGTAAITDFVYPNVEVLITPATVLKPGDTIGVSISGIGGALASAANAEVKIIEAEMPL